MTTATAPKRRMGSRNSATHAALLDATEAVMREEGYAAVTSRRVAERAGINQQTVYYYFATMDDLLLAAYRRRTKQMRARVEEAMAADRPLHALWQCFADPFDAALTMEYLALSNHNKRSAAKRWPSVKSCAPWKSNGWCQPRRWPCRKAPRTVPWG